MTVCTKFIIYYHIGFFAVHNKVKVNVFNDNESSSSGSILTVAVQAIVDKLKWEQHRSSTERNILFSVEDF